MINVLEHQLEFIQSEATHTGLVAGFGSGKSKAATLKTAEHLKYYPHTNAAYYLPTYSLIKDIAFPNFQITLDELGIPYELNKTDKMFVTPIGNIILRSLDNPAYIVGYEVGYSVIDEADVMGKTKMTEAFIKVVGRNRVPLWDGSPNKIDLVSTPEGFNFMYDFFVKKKNKSKHLIRAKSTDNHHLPPSFFETLMNIYSKEQLASYMNGEFVNLTTGNVYYRFDRKDNHSDRQLEPYDVLHIGMDFNVTNMNAVIHVIDECLIAVEEITKEFDTPSMIHTIQQRYPDHSIIIYPDASGNNRKSSGKSDVQLLRDVGFTIRRPSKNPFVRDRVTAMNMSFRDNHDNIVYKVNTDNCPFYTEALEQQTYRNGEPDKQGGFDHINEAGGYCVYGRNRYTGSASAN